MSLRRICRFLVVAGLCLVGACGKYVPVEGILTIDDKPLDGASLNFTLQGDAPKKNAGVRSANGLSDDQGRFRVRTSNDAGVVPGKYKVTVSKMVLPPGVKPPAKDDPDARQKWQGLYRFLRESVPEAYTRDETTPLEIEIPAGGSKDLAINVVTKSQLR